VQLKNTLSRQDKLENTKLFIQILYFTALHSTENYEQVNALQSLSDFLKLLGQQISRWVLRSCGLLRSEWL